MSVSIGEVIRFNELLLQLQRVRRHIWIPGREARENDVEHSYQLAMMAWYINDAAQLGLDTEELLKCASVHDLVEVYAGDIPVLDHAARVGKHKREVEAAARIAAEFSDFPDLGVWMNRYLACEDEASQFIYALDKIMPMIMVYLQGGTSWRDLHYGMEEILDHKHDKVRKSPYVQKLFQQLAEVLRKHPEMFAQRS